LLDFLIPILGIVTPFAFVLGMAAIHTRAEARKQKLRHDTIRLAIEKGQPIPADLLEGEPAQKRRDDRRKGIILLAVAVGLFVLLDQCGTAIVATGAGIHAGGLKWAALIPGLVGVALLVNWALTRHEKKP
jgi:hypothetical protein